MQGGWKLREVGLRALGDRCVLPLTRYLQSQRSRYQQEKRAKAAAILGDLAQPWSLQDLIDLLGDPHPGVRFHVVRAIERLTGRRLSPSREEWKSLSPEAIRRERERCLEQFRDRFRPGKD